jgi:hypothetical protein
MSIIITYLIFILNYSNLFILFLMTLYLLNIVANN